MSQASPMPKQMQAGSNLVAVRRRQKPIFQCVSVYRLKSPQMHYFIDGYNLLFRLIREEGELHKQRQQMIDDFCEKLKSIHLDLTLVFDAKYSANAISRSHLGNLEIVYTSFGETADEYILSELSRSDDPAKEIVVTSDKELSWKAKHLYAKTETVENFYKQIQRSAKKKKKKPQIKISSTTKSKTLIPPVLGASKENCLEFYLEIFEEKLKQSEELYPPTKNGPSISEFQRWLALFEERLTRFDDG